jgi:hypothetical protein
MLQISDEALQQGMDRARDIIVLNRLRGHDDGQAAFTALWKAFGLGDEQRAEMEERLRDMLPVSGIPGVEIPATIGMVAGVLVGLLIADSASPLDELDCFDELRRG